MFLLIVEKLLSERLRWLKKNDVVLIAGKGHEEYQIIRDVKVPFSDSQVVFEYFKTKVKGQS